MLYPTEFGNDPLFPKAEDFEVRFMNSDAGKGVFSKRCWKKGQVIAHMDGYRVRDIRQHTLQITPDLHNYDPYFSGYFLHSCDPNISLDMINMKVIALKNIKANSWLYMDYAETEDYLFKGFPCSCGSRKCRSWITGRKETPPVNPVSFGKPQTLLIDPNLDQLAM